MRPTPELNLPQLVGHTCNSTDIALRLAQARKEKLTSVISILPQMKNGRFLLASPRMLLRTTLPVLRNTSKECTKVWNRHWQNS